MRPIRSAATFLALFTVTFSNAQLSGTYTIGGPGADYPLISAALADAVAQGVSGPVEFAVNDGTYDDNWDVDMAAIAGLSAANTITIRSAGNDSSLVTVQSAVPAVDITLWSFLNMRHLRVQDITWKHTAATPANAFRISGDMIDVRFERNRFIAWPGGTDGLLFTPYGPLMDVFVEHNTFSGAESSLTLGTVLGTKSSHRVRIRHNDFTGGLPTLAVGWSIGLALDSNVFHAAISPVSVFKCDSVTVRWNAMELSGTAMQISGTDMSPANNCTDVLVSENTIVSNGIDVSGVGMNGVVRPVVSDNIMHGTGGYGISLVNLDHPMVRENVIDSAYGIGIELYNMSGDVFVEDNSVVMDSAWFYNQGLVMDTQVSPAGNVRVTGNRLHSVDSGLGMELIQLIGGSPDRVLVANNEVIGFSNGAEIECISADVFFNSFLCGASCTVPIALELGADLWVANNVVSVPAGAPATYVYTVGITSPLLHFNVYDYDAGGGIWLSDHHIDLAAANADGVEMNSLLLDPEFIDPATSLMPGNSAMLNTGAPVDAVSTDILGVARSPVSPTPGAYEDIAMHAASTVGNTSEMLLWPNPFSDHLFLQLAQVHGPVVVEVLAVDGRLLKRQLGSAAPVQTVELGELPSGPLVVRCTTTMGTFTSLVQKF